MAHGAPDDSNIVKLGDTHRVDDMAELAARLGSILTFRRDGEVQFLEDFSCGMGNWFTEATDAAGTFYLSVNCARSRGVCMQIATPAAATEYSYVRCYLPFIAGGLIGVQAEYCFDQGILAARLFINTYSPEGNYTYALQYVLANQDLQYLTNGPLYVDIDDSLYLRQFLHTFHNIKLVIDVDHNEYVRAIVNEHVYSLAGKVPLFQAGGFFTYQRESFGLESAPLTDSVMYVDNIVVTRNEV